MKTTSNLSKIGRNTEDQSNTPKQHGVDEVLNQVLNDASEELDHVNDTSCCSLIRLTNRKSYVSF